MYKFVVLSALLAVAASSHLEYAAPTISLPPPTIVRTITPFVSYDGPSSAVFHQSRSDYISKPVVAGYSEPIVSKSIVSTPVLAKTIVEAPVVSTYAEPAWTAPVVSTYAEPAWTAPAVSAFAEPAWAGRAW